MAQSITRPKNITDAQWNQALELYYAAKSKGDRYPELTVAQAALETGWFKSPAGRYNYFGQKATSGQQGSTKSTKEVAGGKTYSTKAKFRDYSNINEAVDDRLSKWGKKYENANNVEEAIGSIWRYNPNTGSGEGYATDTQYGPKLKTILGSMGVSTSDTGNTYQTYQTYQPWKQYGVDTSINLPMNTGEYQTAPEMSETTTTTKERLEAEQAKAELLQKQREKDFLAEVKDRQDQYSESGYQKGQQVPQQEAELDPSYYQVPQIELPNYEAIRYQQAQNQAQILQEQPQYKDGGGIPQRYKNMGFTHVGQKKEGDGQKKWKVLAKKGDKYKVVQGGYRGMKDFSQHGSKKRQDNFWSRMGGRDSAKANDPFSPLYWHKRLGKWEEGGEIEGLVECTNCGWSWDKSESTEKDMYNCHKCGGKSTGESVSQFQEGGRKKAQAQTGYEVPERRGVSLNYDDKGNVVGESSHRMKTETFDDVNWFSFPTLFQDEDGTWVDMSEQAEIDWKPVYEEAKKRGEVIDFGTDKETALKFGEGSWKPKMQTGGKKKKTLYVDSKNDPRYKAYQDSLTLSSRPRYNPGRIMSIQEWEKSHNKGDASLYKEKGIMPIGMIDLSEEPYRRSEPVFKKPQQQVIVKPTNTEWLPLTEEIAKGRYKGDLKDMFYKKNGRPSEYDIVYIESPEVKPKVKGLNLQPIEQAPINIPVQELNFNTPVKAPKSYNVNMQRYNMEGPSDYYQANEEGVDYQRAMEIKAASDAYNKYIQEKYGNEDALKNPKAAERLKQLKQNVEIVPQYQIGGNVYPVNYLPQAQNGGATRADSLALYNNALNKIEFYKNNPDYKKHFSDTNFKSDKVRKNLIKNYKRVGSDNKVTTELIDEISNRSKYRKGPLTPAEKSAMEKKLNTVKFGPVAGTNLTSFGDIVAEQYDTYYNPLAPPIYLHPDISPQGSERYISKRFADTTDIPYYDPIAVAPFDVIKNNPKLVAERIKKYGTSGVPKSYLSKPELQPRVEALNLPPIEQTPINIPVQELNFNTPVKAPKSYNVNMQRYNMEGPSDYYNTNQEGVDYERAMQIKAASDAYNKDIEKRYGPQNEYRTPKSAEDAAERLKQLRSEFEVTLNYQTGGEINEDGLTYAQKGTTVYPTVGSIEKTLMEKTGITGFRKKAQEKAQAQGIKGEHNGGLDAVRHAASSAKAASLLPPGLGFIAANTLGAAHEVDRKMYWNETASDLYNNFAGSIIGSIPFIDDDTRQDLVIEAQKRGFLHNVNKLEEGGEINEDGLTYAQNGTTFFTQVSNPFNPGGYQSPFMQQPAKTAVQATPTRKPAPKVSTKPSESPWPNTEQDFLFAQLPIQNPNTINRTAPKVSTKPSEYEYLFDTDNSKKIDTKGLVMPKFNGIREGSGNSSQEILNYQQEKNKKIFQEEVKKQEQSKATKELSDFRKEITSKAILEDAIENDEVSLDMSNYRTKKDVMNLQKMLTDKGYNLNPQGKFANNGIDGKLGNVTKNAMIKYNQHNSDSGYDSIKEGIGFIGDCQETQCSEYMQNELFRNLQPKVSREDWNKNTGLYGDAWNIGKNIVKAGGKKVEKEQIKPGDVVTMFTGGRSPFQAQANAAGTGTTHTGLIDKVNPDGSYYILHNNHSTNLRTGDFEGREYRDLVKDGVIISAGQRGAFTIRSVFRPDYKKVQLGEKKVLRDDVKLFLDPKKAVVLSSKEYDNKFTSANAKNKLLNTFIKPLNDTRNKKTISKVFGLGDDEYQSLSKLTLGILGQETSFGTNAKYTTGVKEAGATVSKLAGYVPAAVGVNEVVKYVGGEGFIKNDEVSKGAGRLKYETNFGADDLTELGITQDNFDDEDKAPLTTMYKLATDYKKFLKKGYNKKDAMYRAVTVYNVSLGHVSQGKKIEDWAKNYDVDYTNKVLNYSTFFNIGDNKKQYKTTTDELLLHPNVYKWRKKLEKEKKL